MQCKPNFQLPSDFSRGNPMDSFQILHLSSTRLHPRMCCHFQVFCFGMPVFGCWFSPVCLVVSLVSSHLASKRVLIWAFCFSLHTPHSRIGLEWAWRLEDWAGAAPLSRRHPPGSSTSRPASTATPAPQRATRPPAPPATRRRRKRRRALGRRAGSLRHLGVRLEGKSRVEPIEPSNRTFLS